MEIKHGIPVSPGIAIGEVFLLEAEGVRIPEHFISESQVESEVRRLEKAVGQALAELEDLAAKISAKAGATVAEIFSAHAGMLRDSYFHNEFVETITNKKYTAEFAVARTMRQWRQVFQDDAFLVARVPDLDDLERRLLRNLLGAKREELGTLKSEVILVAHDLSPSQTATVDTSRVKAIAIDAGGPTGHTAIIANALGIPAVVGCTSVSGTVSGGDIVIVDGVRGVVIIDPDEETLASYRMQRKEAMQAETTLLREFRDQPAQTLDGRLVHIYANIEFPREVARAVQHGAEGIGLYRTEFLYLTSERSPTEEEHFDAYMEAIRELHGRPIIIRTVDLGADKFAGTHDVGAERNPFLGRRSIRYCLEHPDVLKAQLRAILRASVHGNVKVMFPLVSSLEELVQLKACLEDLRQDFERLGEAYDRNMEVGIMVEVPSAAVVASMLAPHADFFSIGTNDLIQYTLAIDRANEHVAHMYRPLHPAVLRLIKMTADAARDAGIEVGLCGEMASEAIYALLLVGLGIDHLSVAPAVVVPELKKIIRSVRSDDARKLAERILACTEADAAMATLMQFNRELCPDLFPSPAAGPAARA